jgi:hypothetical protein
MYLREFKYLLALLVAASALATPIRAQLISGKDSVVDKFNALFPIDHSRPMTVSELCHRLDCVAIVTPATGSPGPMTALSNNGLVHIDMVPKASKAEIRREKAMGHHHKPVKPPILHHPHQAPPKRRQV